MGFILPIALGFHTQPERLRTINSIKRSINISKYLQIKYIS